MIRLDAATVLLQWATGGMLFCWFTTRRRVAGLGYGWLLRGVYACFAAGAAVVGMQFGAVPVREASSIGVAVACIIGLAVSVRSRAAGVAGQVADHDRRSARVAAMTGIERRVEPDQPGAPVTSRAEFSPHLDLVPVAIGVVGLVATGVDAGGNVVVAVLRTLIGAAFIGAISDAMLLGHWYLVQPGLPRRLLNEIVVALGVLWPLEVGALLLPTGMISVWSGAVDDGWGGLLGWMWAACALSTIVLIGVTRAALRERAYSAVMAATGLLYLAILTGFGTDIVARAVLS